MNFDVLVIGGGVIGSSIAYHLTKSRRLKVGLIEQDTSPGKGATSKSGGLFRMHHTLPSNCLLSLESYSIYSRWREFLAGDCEFIQNGFSLIVGDQHLSQLRKNIDMMKSEGITVSTYTPEEYQRMEPNFSKKNVGAVVYEPCGGHANPVKATDGFLRTALTNGMDIIEGTNVHRLIKQRNHIVGVDTNIGEINAPKVILATGSWSNYLTESVGISVPVRAKRLGVAFIKSRNDYRGIEHSYIDDITDSYFRPINKSNVLVGIKADEWDVDLETNYRKVGLNEVNEAIQRISIRFPHLQNALPYGGRVSFDGYTPDQNPIIGSSHIEGLYYAFGFSGGGFKVAPAVGRAVQHEVEYGSKEKILEPFRLNRFRKMTQDKFLYKNGGNIYGST
ncbi:NAD(P)/FAD-dependent oxidoreductase [Halobacillus sp. B23F22_1]|uniref:NAD(P)/FAD-dependent oxidoreductase n=1 Tax=Halobacillus sp. B23F22_1 TaxID=3459514 RepID=UPI00373FC084